MKMLPKPAAAIRHIPRHFSCFSIIELLSVVAIICVIAAFLIPGLKSARENARKSRCAGNMQQFGISFRLYQADHKGMYPNAWVDDQNNWQSYLCGSLPFAPWVGPNSYLPTNAATYVGAPGGSKRVVGKYLCPTIVQTYGIPNEGAHSQWGYCLNGTRTQISYGASGWPWFLSQYANADLDSLYTKPTISAVMTCGNAISSNSDNDWNAFTSAGSWDWIVQPIHSSVVNTLFMDGHVDIINVTTTDGINKFNLYWYNSVPSTLGNPW